MAAVGDRKSKRARKGRAPIRVSADDTTHDLKLKIVQTLNVHPHNALLHLFRNNTWQPIGDGDTRLAGKQTLMISVAERLACDIKAWEGTDRACCMRVIACRASHVCCVICRSCYTAK